MIEILKSDNASLARKWISENLLNNVTPQTCITLANLIILDYEARLNLEPAIQIHLNNCLSKLKAFLKQKVITDDSFSVAIMLFTVAISPTPIEYEQKENIVDKSENIIVETLISTNFNQTTQEERKLLRLVLKDLLKARNSHEIMNVLKYEPDLFRIIILHAIKKYKRPHDIIANIKTELNKILGTAVKHHKKIETFKQTTSKIFTAVCSLAVGAISVVTAGAALALAVVPLSILAVSYAPKLGEKIGAMLLDTDQFVINEQKKIELLKVNARKNYDELLTLQQSVGLTSNPELTKKQEMDNSIETNELSEIKQRVGDRISQDDAYNIGRKNNKSQVQTRLR